MSVIIRDSHVEGVAVLPAKTDSPLVIDADAVLPTPGSFQRLEAIGRRDPEVMEHHRVVKHAQLSARRCLDVRMQAAGRRAFSDQTCLGIGEVPDHGRTITQSVI